ncbi:hypothetical protein BS78_02G024000 [Paspalum vaginatum]|nr:hypothetical protein BS78_02G024000 [Paspalum vaginatum]
MAEFKIGRLDGQPPRIRNVPIAITPEGFWCCPSQSALQKTAESPNRQGKPRGGASPAPSKASSVQRPTFSSEKRAQSTPTRSRTNSDEQVCPPADVVAAPDPPKVAPAPAPEKRPKQHKISVGFGQLGTSDLKVVLYGKEGVAVKMIVHKNILSENSTFFADRISRQSPVSCIEVPDCEDVEIYVETVGLMYCKDVKQNVPRVLRILKVAESLGFHACIMSCLDYLEAVPWVGDEEENVVSSIRQLHNEDHRANPLLKRVASDVLTNPPNDTLTPIIDLVLKSREDRGRCEMKTLVLKLFKENNNICTNGSSADSSCVMTLYSCFQNCLDSLLALFRQASDAEGLAEQSSDNKEQMFRKITLVADNLLWLAEILSDRNAADELAVIWASQVDLAEMHSKIPVMHRHLVSCVTARLLVAIGKGEALPSKDTRRRLLDVWLQHGCRWFDRTVVEEGVGESILTLPLEDQQAVLLAWLGRFLKA